MASNINTITLSGHLGKDAEFIGDRRDGIKFSIANTRFVSKDKGDHTNWIDCSYWGEKRASAVIGFLKKGTKIFLTGELRITTKEYDGQKRYFTSILVSDFDFPSKNSNGGGSSQESQPATASSSSSTPAPASNSDDDLDLPSSDSKW